VRETDRDTIPAVATAGAASHWMHVDVYNGENDRIIALVITIMI